MKKNTVIYFGYDIKTLFLLMADNEFEILGVAVIPELMNSKSKNLGNIFFRYVYSLKLNKKELKMRILYTLGLNVLCFCMSSLFRKYKRYLLLIIKKNIPVLSEEYIKSYRLIDLFIINNWWMLSSEILKVPKFGSINIHPSKLPQYRGSLPTLWALKNGDSTSAVSFIVLNNKMDAGDIISQYSFDIGNNDNSIDLEFKIENIIAKYLLADIKSYVLGQKDVIKQEHSISSYTAKYYDYMRIKLNEEKSSDIMNKIKLYPYLNPIDMCYIDLSDNERVHLRNCQLASRQIPIGNICVHKLYLYMGCINGSLKMMLFKDINIHSSINLLKKEIWQRQKRKS